MNSTTKKLSILITLCMFLFGGNVIAQNLTQVTGDMRVVKGDAVFNTTAFISKDYGKNWGISYFALITEGFSEAYAGPYWNINEEFSVGIGGGFGQLEDLLHLRTGAFAVWTTDNHEILLFLEKGSGEDNHWYSLSYELIQNSMRYGAAIKRFYGVGPTVAYTMGTTKFTLAPLYDLEEKVAKPTVFIAHEF